MEGFFTKKETQSKSRPEGRKYSCSSCCLYKNCKSIKMEPYGNFKKKILVIGEAPGETEDRLGKPFQGKAGKLLSNTCKKMGIDLFEDCLNTNAVHCRPTDKKGNNRTPTNLEIESCRKINLDIIEKYKPRLIILLGNAAVYSIIGHRWKKDLGGITKWRGWTIPDQDFQTWICPTFHPSYIERANNNPNSEKASVEEVVWKKDLQAAFDLRRTPLPVYEEPRIEIIEDLYMLTNVKSDFTFDFETTGKKPHRPGHRIICCAVANNENHAYVFMIPSFKEDRKPLLDILGDPKLGKIAQNMKFEDEWSAVRLKQKVENWVFDTMIAAHILDNRPGVTNLKFQVYVNFGIVDYASEIAPYLQNVDEKDSNSLNRITDLIQKPGGKEKIMKYCGLDAIYEFRLANLQRGVIKEFGTLPF